MKERSGLLAASVAARAALRPPGVLAIAVCVVASGASGADHTLRQGGRLASSAFATYVLRADPDTGLKEMAKEPQRAAMASRRHARSHHRRALSRSKRRLTRYFSTSAPALENAATLAVRDALAQLGKPYGFGQAGPRAFDCSGLTQHAWRAAGVLIPRTSQQQARFGRAVEIRSLQPGDVVVYYRDRSHVALYVGSGRVVHAPHPGSSVRLGDVFSMPIDVVRRP